MISLIFALLGGEEAVAVSILASKSCATKACVCEHLPSASGCKVQDLDYVLQDIVQCSQQPHLAWCKAACVDDKDWSWCQLDLDAVKAIDRQAKSIVRLQNEANDNWRSLADNGGAGDCDDLTSTVLDLLDRAGAPPAMLGRALVRTKSENKPDAKANHQVGLVEIDGAFFVVGDALGDVRPIEDTEYTIVWQQSLIDGLKWRIK